MIIQILAITFFISALLTSKQVSACFGEAQLIANILQVKKHGLSECLAYIDPAHVRFYATSSVCPLDIDEISQRGVSIGFKDGHDCSREAGDEINGIVVQSDSGSLSLE